MYEKIRVFQKRNRIFSKCANNHSTNSRERILENPWKFPKIFGQSFSIDIIKCKFESYLRQTEKIPYLLFEGSWSLPRSFQLDSDRCRDLIQDDKDSEYLRRDLVRDHNFPDDRSRLSMTFGSICKHVCCVFLICRASIHRSNWCHLNDVHGVPPHQLSFSAKILGDHRPGWPFITNLIFSSNPIQFKYLKKR